MMKHRVHKVTAFVCTLSLLGTSVPYLAVPQTSVAAADYQVRDPFFNFGSGYNYYTSEHFQFIWGNSGDAGKVTEDFLRKNAANMEQFWDIYVNGLGMNECAESVEARLRDGRKYKLNIYISGTGLSGMQDDWAYMSYDNQGYPYLFCCVGAMQTDPASWVMPHEFGHAITAHQLGWNRNKYSNTWWEALGNWFREQWIYRVAAENGWSDDFSHGYGTDFFETYLKNMCFTSPFGRDYYAAWVLLQYLTENPDHLEGYGTNFVRTMLQEGEDDEYPLRMIDRLAPADMKETLGHFAKRMATLDFAQKTAYRKRLDALLSQGAWNWQQIYTMLEKMDGTANTYTVPTERAPQAAGINVVPLNISGSRINVTLDGRSELQGADWRACIVVEKQDGTTVYSDLFGNGGSASLEVPADAVSAYLTVTATPDDSLYCPSGLHWHNDSDEFGETRQPFTSKHRYPYAVTIEGADIKTRPLTQRGHQHANGGGFVADSARVDDSVYVGPNAAVIGNATVTGNAIIDGYAMIAENASISGNAYIGDCAMVMGRAKVSGSAKVLESACIWDNYTVKDNAVVKGVAFCMANGSASGQAILDGDYYDDGSNSAVKGACYGWYGTQTYLDARPYTDGLALAYDFDTDSGNVISDRYTSTYALPVGAKWEAERTGAEGVMTLDGADDYIDTDDSFAYFRDGAEYQFATLWRGGAANQKLFYFGDLETCLYFTPQNTDGVAELVMRDSSGEQHYPLAQALPRGEWSILRLQIGTDSKLTVDLGGGNVLSADLNLHSLDSLLKAMHHADSVSMIGAGADGGYYNGSLDFARVYFKPVTDTVFPVYSVREDISDEPAVTTTTTESTSTATSTTTSATSAPDGGGLRGDVNEDSIVDVRDAVLMARYVGGDITAVIQNRGLSNGDLDNSGGLGTPDLTRLLRILARLEQ